MRASPTPAPAPPPPPPSPILDESSILITTVVEKSYEPIDVTKSWVLGRMPVDQIGPQNSNWNRIKQAKWIFVCGKSYDSKFCCVAVHEDYLPWLRRLGLKFEIPLPLEPEVGIRIRGSYTAAINAEERCFNDAVNAIITGCDPGLGSRYRELVPLRLRGTLEWVIVSHEVLEDSMVRTKFVQNLFFIVLNVLNDYETPLALELLGKSENELLETFWKVGNIRGWRPKRHLVDADDLHWVSVLRFVIQFSNGRENFLEGYYDLESTPIQNATLCSVFMSIAASKPFGSFDVQKMRNALSKSKVFDTVDVSKLEIGTWTLKLGNLLPFGNIQYAVLPNMIQGGLGSEQLNLVRVQIAHIYQQYPFFNRRENDVLVLLTSGLINSIVRRVVTEWSLSNDGRSTFEGMINNLQGPQTCEDLGLNLAALLCYRRLRGVQDTPRTTNGSYLLDFDALLNFKPLYNEQATLEQMMLSFLRVLKTFKGRFQDLHRFLTATLGMEDTPVLHPLDGYSDQYFNRRIEYRPGHDGAFEKAKLQALMKFIDLNPVETGTDDDNDWDTVSLVGKTEKLGIK
ncbi:uncharacterized protein K444DRAFT_667156 [Hyaloscypha bicolor E]|uniref:Uncharacterized protein n=1 Tax=Hyaloscypha bicolor E TaxID=1095630 RepID=A0A2J6SX62_9HELO|nr:uncharacterized protein K444DRAFT_667156 [Hyaloscypha bicolor E]PMD55331.1 hypothetical protein K444DRAFT_667156 [Hyaloscypha bicolor E]